MKKILMALLVLTACGTTTTLRTSAPVETAAGATTSKNATTTKTVTASAIPVGTEPIDVPTATGPPVTVPELARASEPVVRVEIPTTITEASPATPGCRPACVLVDGNIPKYPNRQPCTAEDAAVIREVFAAAGANWDTQQWAVFIASRESSCDYTAYWHNPGTGDDSSCAFQLNARGSAPLGRNGYLTKLGYTPAGVRSNMRTCAEAAAALWSYCGRNPWLRVSACNPKLNATRWYI